MAVYNPNNKYSWSNDELFSISGREFGLLLNTFRAILSTEQAQQILLVDRANDIIENMMAENVANGKIKEVRNEQKDKEKTTGEE